MTTKSPIWAGRSIVSSRAIRSCSAVISFSTSSAGHVGLAAADLQTLVVAQLGGGAHADLDRERHRPALGRQVAEVEVGIADGMDPARIDRSRVPEAHAVAHRLVQHGRAADALDDHRRRHLALAEAGDAQVAAQRARRLCDPLLDLLRRHLRLDADAGLGKLGDLCGNGDGSHVKTRDDSVGRVMWRAAAWVVTGPVGHLVAGLIDWLTLVARWAWARARGRRLYP